MKLYFVRHGEAMDDIENRYGGWYDPDLSPAGVEGAKKLAQVFKEGGVKADLILSSPLKRAVQTAEILSKGLGIPFETFIFLKERNTYGLLCGENKDEAKVKYPEMVAAGDKDEEVWGFEPMGFFVARLRVLVEELSREKESSLICVTHGKLLKTLFTEFLKKDTGKFHDNCWAETELVDGQFQLLRTEGIELF